ncbi:MAG: hypothetical protein ACREQ5_14375 [Candidatus Dormibacteria bacterium]
MLMPPRRRWATGASGARRPAPLINTGSGVHRARRVGRGNLTCIPLPFGRFRKLNDVSFIVPDEELLQLQIFDHNQLPGDCDVTTLNSFDDLVDIIDRKRYLGSLPEETCAAADPVGERVSTPCLR